MTYTNIHEFTGRIANVPETKYFPSGKVVTKFSVAIERPYASEEPIYCPCESWDKLAETAANWLEIGKIVTVQGEMKIESWTDKNTGEMRSKAVYLVKRLQLLTGSKKTKEVLEITV